MKALYLVFHGFADFNGISKKIFYQTEALRQCGVDTKLCYIRIDEDGTQKRMVDNHVLENYGTGITAKLKKRLCYRKLTNYIIDNQFDLLYIRSDHNANPLITRMIRKTHQYGTRIVMEIPTYPYEGQFKGASLKSKIKLQIDILCRRAMAKHLDHIVSFTDYDTILGAHNISISNGIDFNCTPVKKNVNDISNTIHLIGVAEIHYWHAFDRLIQGLADYYSQPQQIEVIFHIVGYGYADLEQLKELTKKCNLENYVLFHGNKSGIELDEMFEKADMGIASLGRHRSKITNIKTLKNREYAARGVPFIYSETDDDFEQMPYIMKAPADETPIDIKAVIDFYRSVQMSPQEIRNTIISTLSWKNQMQKVIDQTFTK